MGYVLYFVGAGLISGAIVHHPLDPARYTKIAATGVLVFLAATVLNEFVLARERPALPRMVLVIGASLMLSFGIGMLSGGLQHFEDFPARGAVLVPLGIVVSFVAFVVKDAKSSWRRIFGPIGLVVLLVAAASFVGLRQVASTAVEEGGDGGHSHGSETAEDDHGDAETTPQHEEEAPPAATTSPEAPPSKPEPGEAVGHEGDGHSH
ncbi:hypothetical protein [Actinacidiphila glaucinigra]|uniref:hypothetical protein n=1 Tax=Actinacidiphila glaucinigra TaxID=235986 RepID=UPI0037123387